MEALFLTTMASQGSDSEPPIQTAVESLETNFSQFSVPWLQSERIKVNIIESLCATNVIEKYMNVIQKEKVTNKVLVCKQTKKSPTKSQETTSQFLPLHPLFGCFRKSLCP